MPIHLLYKPGTHLPQPSTYMSIILIPPRGKDVGTELEHS